MNAPRKSGKHPKAGAPMTGAEMVIQVLADEGVDTIFGYSGGAILPTYDAIFRWNRSNPGTPINLVVPANEQGAGFMAAGYSRASGKVGVSLVTSGPAATNSVTPVRDCMADSVPMVLICGQVARPAIGTDAFQEAPVFNIMSACAKHVFLVKNEAEIEETMRTAFFIARTGRPGPVVVDLPKDVQNWQGVFKGEGMLPLSGYQDRLSRLTEAEMPKEVSREFFRLLKRSRRPLLYVGGGAIVSGAADTLRKFMKKFQIPAVTTLMGIGAVDTTDPLCLGMLGMHGTAYGNYAVDDCDMLICVGARFDDRVAGVPREFARNAVVAHIDIDAAEIGKVRRTDWRHVGDAARSLRALMDAGRDYKPDHAKWLEHVARLKASHPQNFNRESGLIQPQAVLEALNKITKGDAVITTGVGQHQMFAAQYMDFHKPRTWLTSGSMGTMGFGLPAAIGAQFACPGKLVIDVDGDGSLRMNIGEMETATTYEVPVKVLLLNNLGDGMVVQWQSLYFDGRFSGTDKALHQKDFVKAAEADGFKFARRVTGYDELQEALEAFVKFDGPAFLEVMTDKNAFVYPMVGPGMAYRDMLTGPHIQSREAGATTGTLDTSDSF
ncbi:MAG TPA: biosynthetic-type acetolactate synthase large subunit [Candidatus Hydrogenedentes bacterium]|nr:biosynthetic-type acetolactate synthase large subunit [Candidatus Hydrogenedentota bacterium]